MDDSQRETMFNAWKNSKKWVDHVIEKTDEGVTVSATYEGKVYSETCNYKSLVGSADAYNVAFNMLLSTLRNVNKDIEMKYEMHR